LSRFTSRVSSTYLPTLSDLIAQGPAQAALHEQAATLTRRVFGRRVFVRAVVEVANFERAKLAPAKESLLDCLVEPVTF